MQRQDIDIEQKMNHAEFLATDAEKMARSLFQCAKDPILFVDSNYDIVSANQRCSSTLGWTCHELQGRNCFFMVPRHKRAYLKQVMESLKEGRKGIWVGKSRMVNINDEMVPVELTVQRLDLRGRFIYMWIAQELNMQNDEHSAKGTDMLEDMGVVLSSTIPSTTPSKSRVLEKAGQETQVLSEVDFDPDTHTSVNENGNSPEWSKDFVNWKTRYAYAHQDVDNDLLKLTPTEMEICKHIESGLSSKEIAELMKSSFETIQTHRKNIRRKMGLRGRKTALCTFLKVQKGFYQCSSCLKD